MNRKLLVAVLSVWGAVPGMSIASAAEKTIEAKAPMNWQPNVASASVGDVVEWKMGSGTPGDHGVRITNWAAVKGHLEVETVTGQEAFDATTGENGDSTTTAGKVLLRVKVKSLPAAPAKITYECIVHGGLMKGEMSIGAAQKTIEAKAPMKWEPNALGALVGDLVEWKMGTPGPGSHGVRITNWAAVKSHVEVVTVTGQQAFNSTTGKNDAPTTTPGNVLLRLKVKSVPPAPGEITYDCIVHGSLMKGTVSIAPAPSTDTSSLELVKEFFAKFGMGDIPGVLNTMSDDVDWFIPGPSAIPYAGQRNGKVEVGTFFSKFSDAVEVQGFEPREFISQNDKVVVLGHEVLKVKANSNVVNNEWVMVFTITNDKISKFRSYEDTAALGAAFEP